MLMMSQFSGFGGFSRPFASFIFNGVDEKLMRQFAAGGSATVLTLSWWAKVPLNVNTNMYFFSGLDSSVLTSCSFVAQVPDGSTFFRTNDSGAATTNQATANAGYVPTNSTWNHFVYRYNSPDGTAGNRQLFWRNNVAQGKTDPVATSGSEVNEFFRNTNFLQIGRRGNASDAVTGKMAFIDILDGVAGVPTDFAFDNGGVWTRKPYAGSYGTQGSRLDGSRGFIDASPNGFTFSGVNMDQSNLDYIDLPPYIIP